MGLFPIGTQFVVPKPVKTLLCLLSILILQTAADAAVLNCSHLDIRDGKSAATRKLFDQPRSASDVGWCYAYTAADLLSAKIDQPLSALQMSLLYNSNIGPLSEFFRSQFAGWQVRGVDQGGWLVVALQETLEHGKICPEKDFQSSLPFGTSLAVMMSEMKSVSETGVVTPNSLLWLQKFQTLLVPALTVDEIRSSLQGRSSEFYGTMVSLGEKACANSSVALPHLDIKRIVPHSTQPAEQELDPNWNPVVDFSSQVESVLQTGQPVGIDFNTSMFLNRSEIHSAVIVGRDELEDQCRLKIRNSWGPLGCTNRKDGVLCDSDGTSIWVTREMLYQYVGDAVYLKDQTAPPN